MVHSRLAFQDWQTRMQSLFVAIGLWYMLFGVGEAINERCGDYAEGVGENYIYLLQRS